MKQLNNDNNYNGIIVFAPSSNVMYPSGKDNELIKVIPEAKLLTLSENGYGKRTNISEFSGQKRGGKGVIALNTSTRNGKMVAAVQVLDGDEVMLIGNKGTMIRTKVDQISVIGRNTQGVKVVTTREAEMLVDAVGFKESLDEEESS